MNKVVISTTNAPAAVGPYSQATKFDQLIFVSGQLPIDLQNGEIVKGGMEAQTRQALKNLNEVLLAAGASLATVLKTTIFIKNMNDFARINDIYSEFFSTDPPARSSVEVSKLPKDALIEIEAVAHLNLFPTYS